MEHKLTDKQEVLLYCPLTIRQKLLYAGLKKNIRIEELLAGLGLGNGTTGGVSSLMNLVMQFRKVCNHPELFERREAKSPLVFSLPPLRIPRLLALDRTKPRAERRKFSVYRSDRVHRERLEVPDSAFGFLRFVDLSPGELEQQVYSLYHRWLLLEQSTARQLEQTYAGTSPPSLLLPVRDLPEGLRFTGRSSTFLSHCDQTIVPVPETISHRIHRSRHLVGSRELEDGSVPLVPEFLHVPRPSQVRRSVPTDCPSFLLKFPPRVGALPPTTECSSRTDEYRRQDHARVWVGPGVQPTAKQLLLQGAPAPTLQYTAPLLQYSSPSLHYTAPTLAGLQDSAPSHGWSNIVIPDKNSLITDAGKLFVLAVLAQGGGTQGPDLLSGQDFTLDSIIQITLTMSKNMSTIMSKNMSTMSK